jgi:hypothetical protein
MALHCWEDGPQELSADGTRMVTSTCLLEAGHEDEHEWTPDDEITVTFLPEANEEVLN